jgi:hypothetical protein
LSGLTAKLGSEFWNASPLSEFGMTSTTLMTAALADYRDGAYPRQRP